MKKIFILFTLLMMSYQLSAYEALVINHSGESIDVTLDYDNTISDTYVIQDKQLEAFQFSGMITAININGQRYTLYAAADDYHIIVRSEGIYWDTKGAPFAVKDYFIKR